ncbi:MAG: hypothetical protein Kow0099_31240 [Candidatus Abyssubacteria bacterium]
MAFVESYEVGIFFDLKAASRTEYVAEAWEIFMRSCDPSLLKGADLFHGELSGLLLGQGHRFCIAVRTPDLDILHYVRNVFAVSDEKRLAPAVDRLRETDVVQKYQLKYRGRIDSKGRLKTPRWSRIDHELCRALGWPYVPKTYPKYLERDRIDELEKMSAPALRPNAQPTPTPSLKPARKPPRKISAAAIIKKAVIGAVVLLAASSAVYLWIMRDQVREYLDSRKTEVSERTLLGNEAYAKRKAGYAVAGVLKPGADLDLADLNRKFGIKDYHLIACSDPSLVDAVVYCTNWFATNESGYPSLRTTTQAFLKMEMKTRDGTLIWTCLSKGTKSAPGSERENPQLKKEALLDAIENMDISCLTDGKSLRSFQANEDYAGLRNHVAYLMANRRDEPVMPEEDGVASLKCKLHACLADQWLMSHQISLTTGSKLEVVILEERGGRYRLRVDKGMLWVPKRQVQSVEPFTKEQFAKNMERMLAPVKKEFTHEWQHRTCQEFIDELSEKYSVYGPPLPGVCVAEIRESNPGENVAVLKTASGEAVLKKGQQIAGFTVVGIDAETDSVLVQMGKGGEVLRIWPAAAASG